MHISTEIEYEWPWNLLRSRAAVAPTLSDFIRYLSAKSSPQSWSICLKLIDICDKIHQVITISYCFCLNSLLSPVTISSGIISERSHKSVFAQLIDSSSFLLVKDWWYAYMIQMFYTIVASFKHWKIILVNMNSFWFQHSLYSSKVKFGGSLSFLSKIGFILKFWKTCFQMQEK